MLVRLPSPSVQKRTKTPASLHSIVAGAGASWPARPDASILSRSIPLFFISPDRDGFWIASDSDFRIGGIFLFRRSALRFAQRQSAPNRCATMILEEPHDLTIDNRGNRFADLLRPLLRHVRLLASKIRSAAAQLSRARIEERMLHAALEADLYQSRYKHSNKNDDDLPILTRRRTSKEENEDTVPTGITSALHVVAVFAIFALILAAIIALRVAVWMPPFHH